MSDRDAYMKEGVACYQDYLRGLLDITDNRAGDQHRAAAAGEAARPGRSVPRRRRGQGHGDVLRLRERHQRRIRLLAGRRVRVGRFGRLRPQGDGHHRARRVGIGEAPLPRNGRRHADDRFHRRRRSATCRATCSATACCCRRHIRLVAAFDHRHILLDPDARRGGELRRARAHVQAAALDVGRLRPQAAVARAAASIRAAPSRSRSRRK